MRLEIQLFIRCPLSVCGAFLLSSISTCAPATPTVLDEAVQEARLVTIGSVEEIEATDPLMEDIEAPLAEATGLKVAPLEVQVIAEEFWRAANRRAEDFSHRGAWMKAALGRVASRALRLWPGVARNSLPGCSTGHIQEAILNVRFRSRG